MCGDGAGRARCIGSPPSAGDRRQQPQAGGRSGHRAIGNSPNPLIRTTTPGLESNRRGCLVVDEDTLRTTREGVYAGGDAVTGAATVILAMGAGKKAAASIHEYLSEK